MHVFFDWSTLTLICQDWQREGLYNESIYKVSEHSFEFQNRSAQGKICAIDQLLSLIDYD